jgi:hypothetical protein
MRFAATSPIISYYRSGKKQKKNTGTPQVLGRMGDASKGRGASKYRIYHHAIINECKFIYLQCQNTPFSDIMACHLMRGDTVHRKSGKKEQEISD